MSAREPEDRLDCEVLGYRQWKVNADMRLASAVAPTAWEPEVNEARCEDLRTAQIARAMGTDAWSREPAHDAPHHECHCGFYALHEPTFWYDDDGKPGVPPGYLTRGGDQGVSGLVAGWGRVEVHHEGFRSQFARVVAIAAPKDKRGATLARAVAEEYGVPCVPRDELERVAGEFGSPVPADMRPEKPKDPFADAGAGGFVYGGGSGYALGGNHSNHYHYGAGATSMPSASGAIYHNSKGISYQSWSPAHANAGNSISFQWVDDDDGQEVSPPGLLDYMPRWWFVLVGSVACLWVASGVVVLT